MAAEVKEGGSAECCRTWTAEVVGKSQGSSRTGETVERKCQERCCERWGAVSLVMSDTGLS